MTRLAVIAAAIVVTVAALTTLTDRDTPAPAPATATPDVATAAELRTEPRASRSDSRAAGTAAGKHDEGRAGQHRRATSKPTSSPASRASRPPVRAEGKPHKPGGGLNWDALAACESNGRWAINTGNGFTGGLQFMDSTWLANGGGRYAPSAYLASKAQQIEIAERLYRVAGRAPWPTCGGRL